MSESVRALAQQFRIHDLFGTSAVAGFTPAMWTERPHAHVNHAVWLFAHVNEVRRSIAANLRADAPPASPGAGTPFGEPAAPASAYAAPEALLAEFTALGAAIAGALAEADDATLAATYTPDFPDGGRRTVADALQFLVAHEGLHLGQLSLVRRLHGLSGVAEVVLASMQHRAG